MGGGLRPSTVLAVGALLVLAGPALDHAGRDGPLAWGLWTGGLAVTGVALIMTAPRPWVSPLVPAVGLLFLLQAAALTTALTGVALAARAYHVLAVPRTLALGFLAATERRQHGRPRLVWLAAAGGLGLLRIAWNTLDPAFGSPGWFDAAVSLVLSIALWIFARGLRRRESAWASRRLDEVSATFEDFARDRSAGA
jgi:hypothetical protein